jgi:hypothetical protein
VTHIITRNVRESSTVDEIGRNIPKISATLENRQADHQTSMVEVEGMLNNEPISILIDPGASLSYISTRVVNMCKLQKKKFENSWLVQFATGTKEKVTEFVGKCEFIMNDFKTYVDLNVFPLGSYDLLIGMNWL